MVKFMTKISVVIPVYNVEKYLKESISSVLNQTFNDIELICVNDGSKDNSLEILNEFAKMDSRIKIINQQNQGCGASRNRALNEAVGDYIYFFDPDDYILPNAFEKLYDNAVNNDSDLVIFKIARFRDGEPIDYSNPGFDLEKNFDKSIDFNNYSFNYEDVKKYVLNSSFAPWTKMYKKEFLDRFDDFKFPTNLAFDDVPFHVKAMLRAKKISFIPDYLYHYRLNPTSVNNTSSNGIYIMDIIDIVENFLKTENFLNEFKKEFYLFKVTQILNYIISSNSKEYFTSAKSELLKVKKEFFDIGLNDDNFINKELVENVNHVLNSNSYKEYLLNLELSNLKNENIKLNKLFIKLKKENERLNRKNNYLEKENYKLINSNSWKITKPLRNLKNKYK